MKKILICAIAALAVLGAPQLAEARGGGHGGGGGHWGGGGWHGGYGFRGYGYGFGYGYPYYGYPYAYEDYGPSCFNRLKRVHTKHGWRTRRVTVCY
jgi:hypothetical protein